MTMETEQSQEVAAIGTDGGTQPGPEQNAGDQPGAGSRVEEKTFTQTQVSAMQSESDRQIAELRRGAAQYAMNEEIRNARAVEASRATDDRRLVDEGSITETDAAQRSQKRQTEAEQTIRQQATMNQDVEIYRQILVDGAQAGRWTEAQRLAKEFKLTPEDADVLEADATLTSKDGMRLRAERIAFDKEKKGNERFDSGQVGSKGVSVDQMSSQEKISQGLKELYKG